jgi:hypothetical protein
MMRGRAKTRGHASITRNDGGLDDWANFFEKTGLKDTMIRLGGINWR